MGLKRSGRPADPLRPLLREIDPSTGTVVREIVHEAAPEHVPGPAAHQEFTAASFAPDGRLIQPAHTEVLWIDPRSGKVDRVWSDPLFHGVHSAAPYRDGVVLTCAGTESVLVLDADGRVATHHWLREGRFEAAYPGIEDFRRVDHDALKPHSHHPNFASEVGEDLWVTCFETSDCRALGSGRRIPLPEAIPHDGRLRQGWLWFTQVVGRIVAVDPVTLERKLTIDLRELTATRENIGWCRGVEVVGSRLFVGMTMLRQTRHREVLRQLLLGIPGRKLPTRIVEIDLDRMRVVREIPVGNAAGGTIYSVLAPPGTTG